MLRPAFAQQLASGAPGPPVHPSGFREPAAPGGCSGGASSSSAVQHHLQRRALSGTSPQHSGHVRAFLGPAQWAGGKGGEASVHGRCWGTAEGQSSARGGRTCHERHELVGRQDDEEVEDEAHKHKRQRDVQEVSVAAGTHGRGAGAAAVAGGAERDLHPALLPGRPPFAAASLPPASSYRKMLPLMVNVRSPNTCACAARGAAGPLRSTAGLAARLHLLGTASSGSGRRRRTELGSKATAMKGVMKSATSALTRAVKEEPTTIATARSTTLPARGRRTRLCAGSSTRATRAARPPLSRQPRAGAHLA